METRSLAAARLARHHLRRSILVAVLVAAGCNATPVGTGSATPSAGAPSIGASAAAGPSAAPGGSADAARADLELLTRRLDTTHPNAFHGISREAWIAARDALAARLDDLSDEQAVVELQRLVALLSRDGRDGHQIALPAPGSAPPVLPLRVYEFDDGVFITAALPPHEDLVGARIDAVGGHPIADVLAAIEPLVPRDGPSTVPLFRPVLFLRTEVLNGLGIIEGSAAEATSVALRLTTADGTARDVVVEPVAFDEHRAWAGELGLLRLPVRPAPDYVADLELTAPWRFLEDSGALVLHYTQVRQVDQGELAAFADRAAQPDVDRVVFDLRQNPGGNNHNIAPILEVLRRPEIDRPGRFFVLTDHVTFSAAANFATQLEQSTSAIFAGEAPGGGLNFWDDVTWVRLANWPLPMQVGVSTRYWQFAEPDDPRLTIAPDIAVPSRSGDYFGGRDPLLEAVLAAAP